MSNSPTSPRLLIKILNEPKDAYDLPKVVDTPDGRSHVFNWNPDVRAYTYAPQDQDTIDAIMRFNWERIGLLWNFSVVHPDEFNPGAFVAAGSGVARPASAPAKIPPFVKPELYAAYPVEDLQALCTDCGFAIQGNRDDAENLKRQLAAYYVGRSWAVEEMARVKAEVDRLTKEREAMFKETPPPEEKVVIASEKAKRAKKQRAINPALAEA